MVRLEPEETQPDRAGPLFELAQMALLRQAQGRCEVLVARHFHIPALPSSLYPYEVSTLAEMEHVERAAGALAHLVIYQRQRPHSVEHLYRICLQDDVILRRLERLPGVSLEALLCYVLTHELIHVVRFQRAEQSYLASPTLRGAEEQLVHRATTELLRGAELPGLELLGEELSAESADGISLISEA